MSAHRSSAQSDRCAVRARSTGRVGPRAACNNAGRRRTGRDRLLARANSGQLWGGPETLIVVSSDLSHYHSYETAQRLDLSTAASIENGEWTRLGPNEACG